jgi:hypothetical protein
MKKLFKRKRLKKKFIAPIRKTQIDYFYLSPYILGIIGGFYGLLDGASKCSSEGWHYACGFAMYANRRRA